jgi:hypothetical protein
MSAFGPNDTGFAEDSDFPFASCEDRAVRRVLRLMGQEGVINGLRSESQLATGRPELSFALFHHEYPRWPVRLGASRVRFVHKISLVELLRNFTKTILFRAYMDFAEDYGVDIRSESGGLIFQWPGHTMMILHNYRQQGDTDRLGAQAARITHLQDHGGKTTLYTIEPLKSFVDSCLAAGLQLNG